MLLMSATCCHYLCDCSGVVWGNMISSVSHQTLVQRNQAKKKNLEWHLSKNFTNFIIFVVFNCFKHWPSIITCYCFSLMRIPHTCSVLLLEIYHLQWSGHSSFRGWSPSGTMQTWHVNMCVCSTCAYVYIYIIYIYNIYIYIFIAYLSKHKDSKI